MPTTGAQGAPVVVLVARMPSHAFKDPRNRADVEAVGTTVRQPRLPARLGVALGAIALAIAGLLLAAGPRDAAAAGPPYLGFNDNFNDFELRTTNPLDPILGPLPDGIDLDDLPFLPPDRTTPEVNGGELMARAREGGASVIRYVVPWARVERDRGIYDWSIEDDSYELALQNGVRPLIVLLTSPCWAHPSMSCEDAARADYSSFRPDAEYMDDFGRFVRAAMERYPKAVGFEIWNESNLTSFWGPDPNPKAYVSMLRAVDRATDGMGPHAPILFNGLIPAARLPLLTGSAPIERSYARRRARGPCTSPRSAGPPTPRRRAASRRRARRRASRASSASRRSST
jgi:hypothetical protein